MYPNKLNTKHRKNGESQNANAGLSGNFELRLSAYAKAAVAAGVGVLAAAPSASAKVVYTSAHIVFDGGSVPIDLNHDGINDFVLSIYNFEPDVRRLQVRGLAAQNGVLCSGSSGYPPLALKPGYRIGPSGRYGTFNRRGAPAVNVVDSKFGTYIGGPFANTGERFVGLKFNLNGETHYGWALLRAGAGVVGSHPTIRATLLGYAYDTVAGQTVTAGQGIGQGERSEAVPEAGSLGMLALGWPAWRRREQDGAEPANPS
jgi:hypothetical protein